MSWGTILYLAGFYWPYLLASGLVGAGVGWRSFTPPEQA